MSGYAFTLAYVDSAGNVKRGKVKWQLLNLAILYVCASTILIALKIIAPQLGADQASLRTLLLIPGATIWHLLVSVCIDGCHSDSMFSLQVCEQGLGFGFLFPACRLGSVFCDDGSL